MKAEPRYPILTLLVPVMGLAILALSAGCRQDMRDQSRYEPLEHSNFFADGQASRLPVENTIARGQLRIDTHMFEGTLNGEQVETFPMPLTEALLNRGQERFQIYCTPCHDATGSGNGMVVQRGYAKPRSFHDIELRAKPVGYYFDVITRGFGAMPDYASQVKVEDRWAIVAYIRALQLSQGAEFSALPDADKDAVRKGAGAASQDEHGAEAHHGASHGKAH